MRQAFAHDAVVAIEPGADVRAPGGAITVALCGHWDHEPPCPLAPHHTSATRVGPEVHLRTLFATEPESEAEVRRRIDAALRAEWRLHSSGRSEVRAEEADHARRLMDD
jgi:hypothetical protein